MARRCILLFVCSLICLSNLSEADEEALALYIFGDSLVDVGNNNYLLLSLSKANFPFHGIDFPLQQPTCRFCNGKNTADFLAEENLSLAAKRSYDAKMESGLSFASGGAEIFDESAGQISSQSIPLTKQVDYFAEVHQELTKKLGSSSAIHKLLSKSIFAFVIGSNDLFNYFALNKTHKIPSTEYANLTAKTLQALADPGIF